MKAITYSCLLVSLYLPSNLALSRSIETPDGWSLLVLPLVFPGGGGRGGGGAASTADITHYLRSVEIIIQITCTDAQY